MVGKLLVYGKPIKLKKFKQLEDSGRKANIKAKKMLPKGRNYFAVFLSK